MSALPGARGSRSWLVGKGVTLAVPTLCMPLSDDVSLLWCPGPFPQTFLVAELLPPFPSSCLSAANGCPLARSMLQTPTFQHSAPLHSRRHKTRAGAAQNCDADHVHISYFILLCIGLPPCSLLIPENPFPCQQASPLQGFFFFFSDGRTPSSPSAFHQNCWFLFLISLFIFPSSKWLHGDVSYPFRYLKPSTSAQQVIFENRSVCRCIPDVLVRRDHFGNPPFLPY